MGVGRHYSWHQFLLLIVVFLNRRDFQPVDQFVEQLFLVFVLLVGIALIVNHAVTRLVEAQRNLADDLEKKVSDGLKSVERVSIGALMTDIHSQIGYKYAESHGEAIRRWLDYRVDYGRSSPELAEDDARAEALARVFEEIKRDKEQPDPSKDQEG